MEYPIQYILHALRARNVEVSGPTYLGEQPIYKINGHTFTEEELRVLFLKNQVTSWDVLNYVRIRAARRTQPHPF